MDSQQGVEDISRHSGSWRTTSRSSEPSYCSFRKMPEFRSDVLPEFQLPDDTQFAMAGKSTNAGEVLSDAINTAGQHYWMKDKYCKVCYDCGASFTLLRRRHHCRMCGQIFCHACSSHSIGNDRVCRYCYQMQPGQVEAHNLHAQLLAVRTQSASSITAPSPSSPGSSPAVVTNSGSTGDTLGDLQSSAVAPTSGRICVNTARAVSQDGISLDRTHSRQVSSSFAQVPEHAESMAELHSFEDGCAGLSEPISSVENLLREHVHTQIRRLLRHLIRVSATGHACAHNDNKCEEWVDQLSLLACDAAFHVTPQVHCADSMNIGAYVKVKAIAGGTVTDSRVMHGVVARQRVTHCAARAHSNPRILLLTCGLQWARHSGQMCSLETLREQEMEHLDMIVRRILSVQPSVILTTQAVTLWIQLKLQDKGVALVQNVKRSVLARVSRLTGARILSSIQQIRQTHVLGTATAFSFLSFTMPCSSVPSTNSTADAPDVVSTPSSPVLPPAPSMSSPGSPGCGASKCFGDQTTNKSSDNFAHFRSATNRNRRAREMGYIYFESHTPALGCTILLRGASKLELRELKPIMRHAVLMAYDMRLEGKFSEDSGIVAPAFARENLTLCGEEQALLLLEASRRLPSQQCIVFSECWMRRLRCISQGAAPLDLMRRQCHRETKRIHFYSKSDCTLGQFLLAQCFNLGLRCQRQTPLSALQHRTPCKRDVLHHTIHFFLGCIRMDINIEHTPRYRGAVEAGDCEDRNFSSVVRPIYMWRRCRICGAAITRARRMSQATWQWSFGRCLATMLRSINDTTSLICKKEKQVRRSGGCFCEHQVQNHQLMFVCNHMLVQFCVCWPSQRQYTPPAPNFSQRPLRVALSQLAQFNPEKHDDYDKRQVQRWVQRVREIQEQLEWCVDVIIKPVLERQRTSSNIKPGSDVDGAGHGNRAEDETSDDQFKVVQSIAEKHLQKLGAMQYEMQQQLNNAELNLCSPDAKVHRLTMWNDVKAWIEYVAEAREFCSESSRPSSTDADIFIDDEVRSYHSREASACSSSDDFTPDTAIATASISPAHKKGVSMSQIDGPKANSTLTQSTLATALASQSDQQQSVSKGQGHSPRGHSRALTSPSHRSTWSQTFKFFHLQRKTDAGTAQQQQFLRALDKVKQLKKELLLGHPGLPLPSASPTIQEKLPPMGLRVDQDDPASMIAYSLVSDHYFSSVHEFMRQASTRSAAQLMQSDVESDVEHTFHDDDAEFTVTSMWALQFHALRRLLMTNGEVELSKDTIPTSELEFARSLSATARRESGAGRSQADFAETIDGRLIIKVTVQAVEFDQFKECAQAYFSYMSPVLQGRRASALCPIVGMFVCTSVTPTRTTRTQVIVMVNLFQGRKIPSQLTFDLKGNVRRTGDLKKCIELADGMPIALDRERFGFLRDCVHNDTLYLESLQVMDYSILLGIDAETGTLVAGVIDYLRQYDTKKAIERQAKRVLQTQTNQSAIEEPHKYRARILAMLDTLFTPV